jgi:hypothetical protein
VQLFYPWGWQMIYINRFVANISLSTGRHAIVVTPAAQKAKYLTPASTSTAKETLKGIWRMFSTYPYWDVSYLVAIIFTFGSVVWCINAFFVWLPLQDPSTEFPGEIADAGGITAFIGATIFEFGSILLMIEAVNENRADCFGWALEEVLEENGLIRLVYLLLPAFSCLAVSGHSGPVTLKHPMTCDTLKSWYLVYVLQDVVRLNA